MMELHSAALSIMLLQLIPRAYAQYQPIPMQAMQGIPGMQGMLGMPHMQMPMGMSMMPQQKMPVVVMPYHSKTADKFRRRRKRPRRIKMSESGSRSESSSESESASGEPSFRAARAKSKKKRRRQILTPVVSYVTKDGYVVYQKKIKKDRAKDWLDIGKKSDANLAADREQSSEEMSIRQLKKKYGRKRRRHNDHDRD